MSQIKVILLALILAPLHVMAEQIEVPNEFVDQTPAQASEVNQNFKAVTDGVNAQDVRIQSVENAIAGPEKMVFLGYAEGTGDSSTRVFNHYATNQICKDAYQNMAARVLTAEIWMTLIAEQQMPLPSQNALVQQPMDLLNIPASNFPFFSPLIGMNAGEGPYCFIYPIGQINCIQNVEYSFVACMAPAG